MKLKKNIYLGETKMTLLLFAILSAMLARIARPEIQSPLWMINAAFFLENGVYLEAELILTCSVCSKF